MIQNSLILIIVLSLFCTGNCNRNASNGPIKFYFQNNNTRTEFVKLLKSLVLLNEERVSTLKKWYKLQTDFSGDYLRSPHLWETYKPKRQRRAVLIIILKNGKVPKKKHTKLLQDLLYENQVKTDKKQYLSTRKNNWQTSCSKKAAKVCKKACNNSYKNICSRFKCTSRAKKASKRQCKSSCDKEFLVGGEYSDSEFE